MLKNITILLLLSLAFSFKATITIHKSILESKVVNKVSLITFVDHANLNSPYEEDFLYYLNKLFLNSLSEDEHKEETFSFRNLLYTTDFGSYLFLTFHCHTKPSFFSKAPEFIVFHQLRI